MKTIRLDQLQIKPLSEASHTIGINGRKAGTANPSEWAWAWAAAGLPKHEDLDSEKVRTALIQATVYEAVSLLIDNFEAIMTLDKNNEIVMELV